MTFSPRLLLATTAALAALPAAGASAAPHWSSPKQVVAPSGSPDKVAGAPTALMTAGGAALAFSTDGTNPLSLSGTVSSGLTPTTITTTSAGVAQGAMGADGTIAAVWADNSTGRVAFAGPGGGWGESVTLPGSGVNAMGVAVSPDGTTTVAWRTRSPDSVYELLVAQAPKGGPLGAPQTIDSAKGGIASIDVAAGPDGAVAVVYTRIATVYRTRATVKPAGAAAFEAPQVLSSATAADIDPNVAIEADGTIVAAWGNRDGGQTAFRRPGQSTFEPPVALGSPAYGVDLEPTPQGGSAVAFAGDGTLRAAVKGAGGTFAPAEIAKAPGNIPPAPEIAVDQAGAATVVFGESVSGEIRAVALGGATTVLGFGTPDTLTPVAAAAGPAGQAVALWRNAQGGLSAATHGEDAPPSTGPGPRPGPADRSGPVVRLSSSKPITVSARTTTVRLTFSCDERCAIGLEGNLRTVGRKGKRLIAPFPSVPIVSAPLREAGKQSVTVKLGKFARGDLRKALKARRGARLFITVSARDGLGNRGSTKASISLRARAVKRRGR